MVEENSDKTKENITEIAPDAEKTLMRKRIVEIQEDFKKLLGHLPSDFDEKAFMDEGWEC
ncbi:hypothetical protein HBA92_21665 [Ochrobactrum sp. MR28]|jgi:hypothetical protein|nr:hypothetical protein [Ochrobactrum sp. MR28]MBX8818936.1 hypothetical protein [Ochrobactrum sp. MR31]